MTQITVFPTQYDYVGAFVKDIKFAPVNFTVAKASGITPAEIESLVGMFNLQVAATSSGDKFTLQNEETTEYIDYDTGAFPVPLGDAAAATTTDSNNNKKKISHPAGAKHACPQVYYISRRFEQTERRSF